MAKKKSAGQILRELRGSRTLNEVSAELKICRSSLNMYELGIRTPRDPIKRRIAEFYGVSVSSIFFN